MAEDQELDPEPVELPYRWHGEGPPGVLIGARPADEYLDTLTGDLYILK